MIANAERCRLCRQSFLQEQSELDFCLVQTHLVEVKSAWKAGDPIVLAKQEAAKQLAEGNQFHYALVTKDDFAAFLDTETGWKNYDGPSGGAQIEIEHTTVLAQQ